MNQNVTAIELASSGIRLVTGYCFNHKVYVRQALEGNPLPLDDNNCLSVNEASQSLSLLIATAKKTIMEDLGLIIPILPPVSLSISDNDGTTYISSDAISQGDYNNCLGIILKKTHEVNKNVVFTQPYFFSTDKQAKNPTIFPLGMKANELTIYADSFSIDSLAYKRYMNIFNNCGLRDFYFEMISPLAAISFINKTNAGASKKFDNYLAIDFENDVTYVSYIKNRRLIACETISLGINHILTSLSQKMDIDYEKAADLKNILGLSNNFHITNPVVENIDLNAFHEVFSTEFNRLVVTINDTIAAMRIDGNVPLVCYGTGSDILSLDSILAESLGMEVFIFMPQVIGARNKVFTDCLGAILLSNETYLENQETALRHKKDRMIQSDSFGRY